MEVLADEPVDVEDAVVDADDVVEVCDVEREGKARAEAAFWAAGASMV